MVCATRRPMIKDNNQNVSVHMVIPVARECLRPVKLIVAQNVSQSSINERSVARILKPVYQKEIVLCFVQAYCLEC